MTKEEWLGIGKKAKWDSIGKKAAWQPSDEFPATYGNIPEHMMASLKAYIMEGRPVGHFLTAVLSNNLFEAFSRADDENASVMRDYVN